MRYFHHFLILLLKYRMFMDLLPIKYENVNQVLLYQDVINDVQNSIYYQNFQFYQNEVLNYL